MTPVTIEAGPPAVDYINVPIGVQHRLSWELGTEFAGEFTPDNLTGRAAQMVLRPGTPTQETFALEVTGPAGRVTFTLPDALRKEVAYVVLVEESPGGRKTQRVTGKIRPGVAVNL